MALKRVNFVFENGALNLKKMTPWGLGAPFPVQSIPVEESIYLLEVFLNDTRVSYLTGYPRKCDLGRREPYSVAHVSSELLQSLHPGQHLTILTKTAVRILSTIKMYS